ncbi:hypothetical protein ACOSP7_028419 [Xanthoceras sorbifolium]
MNVLFNELDFLYSLFSHSVSTHSSPSLPLSIFQPLLKHNPKPKHTLSPSAFAVIPPTFSPVAELFSEPCQQSNYVHLPSFNIVVEPHSSSLPTTTHHMVTRFKAGSLKPKVYSALYQSPCASLVESVPTNVNATLADPKWKLAIQEEYMALMKNDTWVLEPPSDTCNIVGHKWVFRVKYKSNGTVAKYNVRLIAKAFHQTPKIDFSETYSLIIKTSTIRVIFTLAASFG